MAHKADSRKCDLGPSYKSDGAHVEPTTPELRPWASVNLEAVEARWLQMCGSCDGGLPMSCTHPDEDYRPVMAALVDEIKRLRSDIESDKWHGR